LSGREFVAVQASRGLPGCYPIVVTNIYSRVAYRRGAGLPRISRACAHEDADMR